MWIHLFLWSLLIFNNQAQTLQKNPGLEQERYSWPGWSEHLLIINKSHKKLTFYKIAADGGNKKPHLLNNWLSPDESLTGHRQLRALKEWLVSESEYLFNPSPWEILYVTSLIRCISLFHMGKKTGSGFLWVVYRRFCTSCKMTTLELTSHFQKLWQCHRFLLDFCFFSCSLGGQISGRRS